MVKWRSLKTTWQLHKPLGWAQLAHRKTRLLVALTGVAFANILIFTQLGLRAMLLDGVTLVPEHLKGDLFLVSAYAPTVDFGSFPKIYLYRAHAVSGVDATTALYIRSANWVNPNDLATSQSIDNPEFDLFSNSVKVLAFNPIQPALDLPDMVPHLDRLNVPGTVLYDRLSQEKLGPIPTLFQDQGIVSTLMNNRQVSVVGLFSLGSTLFDNGHVVMSDWNFSKWFGADSLEEVNVGCLILAPGADVEQVRSHLQAHLPDDVRVMTRAEAVTAEQAFYAARPSGKVLTFGALMGFIVGVILVYQVLYTDVTDHLPEYATLKAIGYSNTSLLTIVIQEAVIIAVFGFLPGYLASIGVYQILVQVIRVPLTMKRAVVIQVFILTVVMCLISGAIAMNKLRSADPADVF